MTSTQELLDALAERRVSLRIEGDRLRYQAPKGAMTAELRAAIGERREELLSILRAAQPLDAVSSDPAGAADGAGRLPLSFAQQRLWFLSHLDTDASPYSEQGAIALEGDLNLPALRRALTTIVARHETLRTVFPENDGTVWQQILPAAEVSIVEVDASHLEETRQAAVEQAAVEELSHPFDLIGGPLVRLKLLRFGPSHHVLLLTAHHLISDGWSIGVFMSELAASYAALVAGRNPDLPRLPLRYADFAVWQRERMQGERLDSELAWWRGQMAGAPPVIDLPLDRPRPARQTFTGDRVRFSLEAPLAARLSQLCREEECTLFMAMLSAFAALLWRYGAGTDIVIGTPIANRQRPELEPLIGFFANTLPLRVRLEGNPTFRQLLSQVRQDTLQAYDHQDLPIERLIDDLDVERDQRVNPVFQVLCALQNTPFQRVNLPGLAVHPIELPKQTAKFDLSLLLAEVNGEIQGELEYATALFDPATVERMSRHLLRLLADLAASPDTPISHANLLFPDEQELLTETWNSTGRTYPSQLVHEVIERQVGETPEADALVCEDITWSYSELNTRANRLAHHLAGLGAGRGSIVAVCMERSAEMVVALLATMKAGAAYLPLDPGSPVERTGSILRHAAPGVVLTLARHRLDLPTTSVRVVAVDEDWDQIASQPGENPGVKVDDKDAVYVIHTSGSTGRPKGVVNTHAGLRNRLNWMQDTFELGAGDAVLQKTPFSFDVSVWEFFWPLMTGAKLVMARPGGHQDAAYLAQVIQDRHITTIHFVPSMLRAFLEDPAAAGCSSLRQIICSGESLTPEVRDLCLKTLGTELHNLYGPTEASIDVTHWPCPASDCSVPVPIGRPIANTRIYILDEALQPVPIGVPGQLFISGGLARGYLGQPGLTADRFVPDPFSGTPGGRMYRTGDRARWRPDGAIEYLGRSDFQVKIRGFRIEPEEIEACLTVHPSVREVVVAAPGTSTQTRLVAYVVPENGTVNPADLRQHLVRTLPEYMVPGVFVEVESIPRNSAGKVDRKALPEPALPISSVEEYVTPRAAVEEALSAIWLGVLGVNQVGRNDRFFDLGGDSIRAIQLVARSRSAGFDLSMEDVFRFQTVAEMARHVDSELSGFAETGRTAPFALLSPGDRDRLPPLAEDAWPLATLQEGMLFHGELAPGSAVYHDVFSFDIEATLAGQALAEALRRLMEMHPVLRSAFALSGYTQPLQIVYPVCALPFSVEDVTTLSLEEQDAEIAGWIEREKRTSFDWSRPPLFRLHLHRRGGDRFQLTLSFHHAVLDGWSVASMLTELLRLYHDIQIGAISDIHPPRSSFRDYVYQEQLALKSDVSRSFWHSVLHGAPGAAIARWPRRYRSGREHEIHHVSLPAGISTLHDVARQAGVPLKSLLLAAHLQVLRTLSSQREVVTGVVTSGRPEEEDAERALGLYLNVLPLRLQVNADSWIDLARSAFQRECAALPHRRYPLAAMQRETGEGWFETLFNFVHFHVYRGGARPEDLRVRRADFFEQTNYPFMATFSLDPFTSDVHLMLNYDGREFAAEQIEEIGRYYAATLAAMASDPGGDPVHFSPLDPEQRRRFLAGGSNTVAAQTPRPLHERFVGQADRTPAATALVCGSDRLTYADLESRSRFLTAHLLRAGLSPGSLAAVCLDRSSDLVIALLAVLRAGAGYVPLDASYPAERLSFMVEDARPDLLITQARHASLWGDHPGRILYIEDLPAQVGPFEPPQVSTQNLAYVLYTSGSTGRPKGVAIQHSSVSALIDWAAEAFDEAELAGVLASTSICFDLSVFELFVPLSLGGTVYLVDNALSLASLPADTPVTLINTVPSAMAELIEAAPLPPTVRTVNLAGEPLSPTLTNRVYETSSVRRVLNLYGPSEDTTYSTIGVVPRAMADPPSIGRPITGTRAYILDPDLQPVGTGIPGELYLAGAGLARSYLNRPGLTAERFLPDPFALDPGARMYRTGDLAAWLPDGEIQYLGRVDRQVKIRGYRIEPGEIEWLLSRHHQVGQVAVTAWNGPQGDAQLAAYVVPVAGSALSPSQLAVELRHYLAKSLPAHMAPSTFDVLPNLPLTPNGKTDYAALPAPRRERHSDIDAYVEPRTETERALATLWEEVLNVARVGATDNFFQLGGHSLLAMRAIVRSREAFSLDLPLLALYESPTLAAFACTLDETMTDESARFTLPDTVLPLSAGRELTPLFLLPPAAGSPLCYLHLVRRLGPERTIYGFQSCGLLPSGSIPPTVEEMAAEYLVALRQVQPHGPYHLAGWSFGGLLAMEMTRQLEAADEQVSFLGLIDSGIMDQGMARPTRRNRVMDSVRLLSAMARSLPIPRTYEELRFVALSLGLSMPETSNWVRQGSVTSALRQVGAIAAMAPRSVRVILASYRAGMEYRGGIIRGSATLFRSATGYQSGPDPLISGTLPLVMGGLDVRPVAGTHMSIVMDEDDSASLANSLRSALENAGGAATSPPHSSASETSHRKESA